MKGLQVILVFMDFLNLQNKCRRNPARLHLRGRGLVRLRKTKLMVDQNKSIGLSKPGTFTWKITCHDFSSVIYVTFKPKAFMMSI